MAVNSATSMLPPIRTPSLHLGPCNGSGASSGGPRLSGATSQGNCYDTQAHLHSPPGLRSNSSTTSDSGTPPANLTEESMMVLSQSIDSIHTMGTSGGSESLDHQVRTLFVSGLPLDTKSRELYLLFRGFKGYLSSTLKPAGKNGKLTAPVGFVTFESREQAEKALSKLQGVKFDPECNQHMRLEFARSNTKVTKPKCGGLSIGFPFAPMGSSPNTAAANLSPLPQPAAFPGVVTSTFLPHLAGFDPTMALIAAQDAANQWSNPAFGYDTSGLFSSVSGAQGLAPAALLQASNFRAILPMNAGGGSAAGLGQHNLQLVQAALAQANAAAALGLITGTPTGPPPPPPQPQQQAPPTPSNSGALRTLGSPTGTPLSLGMTAQQAVTPSTAAAAFAVQFHNQQARLFPCPPTFSGLRPLAEFLKTIPLIQ
ncbi:hypothetical protein AAHC03_024403 [Spirometra sp. Aus1]